jgi:hypothetical protein
MRNNISYKNCLIQGESFQREKNGEWIPQYKFTREDTGSELKRFPTQHYQLNEVFATKDEADEFALRRAMESIDRY